MERKEYYIKRIKQLSQSISALVHRSRAFIICEVVTFVSAIGFVVLYTVINNGIWTLPVAAAMLIVYFAIRKADVNTGEKIEKMRDLRSVYEHEVAYINGDFSCFDSGNRYIDHNHPFSFDLDIFGRNSLFNRVCRAITTGGADRLAGYLSFTNVKNQAEAIDIIAENEAWRAEFMALGKRQIIDTGKIKSVFYQVRTMNIASAAGLTPALIAAWVLIAGFFTSIVLSIMGCVSFNVPVWWGLLQFFGVVFYTAKPLKTVSKAVNNIHSHLKGIVSAIKLCREINPAPAEISYMRGDFDEALSSFAMLDRMLSSLDKRANMLGLFIFNTLFLSDFFLLRKFLRWQHTYINRIDEWTDKLSEVDSLVSMGTFMYNNPNARHAEVKDLKEIKYEAKGLYHPFLGEKAVRNDFVINDCEYYIVTGANMAGKSTFLRAIGMNYVLALNGMPVFADSLAVSRFSLFSSMRTTDDVTRGISYFNAELLRLKQLLNACSSQKRTLIILDEILKGTNSLDKLNGSRLFLQHISTLPVSGVIATHDLELSKMNGERFHNYCFEIQLGTNITYSYKITQGVARNQNATYLLKQMLGNIECKM